MYTRVCSVRIFLFTRSGKLYIIKKYKEPVFRRIQNYEYIKLVAHSYVHVSSNKYMHRKNLKDAALV